MAKIIGFPFPCFVGYKEHTTTTMSIFYRLVANNAFSCRGARFIANRLVINTRYGKKSDVPKYRWQCHVLYQCKQTTSCNCEILCSDTLETSIQPFRRLWYALTLPARLQTVTNPGQTWLLGYLSFRLIGGGIHTLEWQCREMIDGSFIDHAKLS